MRVLEVENVHEGYHDQGWKSCCLFALEIHSAGQESPHHQRRWTGNGMTIYAAKGQQIQSFRQSMQTFQQPPTISPEDTWITQFVPNTKSDTRVDSIEGQTNALFVENQGIMPLCLSRPPQYQQEMKGLLAPEEYRGLSKWQQLSLLPASPTHHLGQKYGDDQLQWAQLGHTISMDSGVSIMDNRDMGPQQQ